MLNALEVIAPTVWTRDFISDQTSTDLIKDDTLALPTFDVTEGLGVNTETSVLVLFPMGGADMEITCTTKYIAPTVAGTEEFGPFLRRSQGSTGGRSYYWARINDGNARMTKEVDGGGFTNLTTDAWVLPQGEVATVTMRVVGTQFTVTWSASTPGTLTKTATDSSIGYGLAGWRTLGRTGYIRTATVRLL